MIILTVRGVHTQPDLKAACKLHNETAGSEQGIAAARALGDLSHKVYTKDNELFFLDVWTDPNGIQTFFSNKDVQSQAQKLFKEKDAQLWVPAQGAFSFNLPAVATRPNRFLGIVRVPVKSQSEAIATFRASGEKNLREARKAGQLSHEIFFRIDNPNELLGIDVWTDKAAMEKHYANHMADLGPVFAGKPDGTIWSAADQFSEW